MVVAPCSIHSLSAIAAGITGNLLVRAADVALKERRKLVLMVRETPFHLGHLRTMAAVAEMGAICSSDTRLSITRPQIRHGICRPLVERVMDLLGVPGPDANVNDRWTRCQRYNPDVGRRKSFVSGREGRVQPGCRPSVARYRFEVIPCQRFEEVFLALWPKVKWMPR